MDRNPSPETQAAPARGGLFRWALRSHRTGLLVCGLGLGLMHLITAPAYAVAAKTVAGGLQTLAAEATPLAKSLEFLTGPVDRLDTIGGYLSYKIFPSSSVVLAIYAVLQGAQVLRGAETKGLFELWYATGMTRTRILRDRVLAFLVTLTGVLVLIWLGTVGGGALAGETDAVPAIGQCIALGLVALFSFALSLMLSQVLATTRSTTTAASVYVVAAYFLANISSQLGPFTFLQYLSPFWWYQQSRTLVPGTAFNSGAMAVLLLASLAALAATWVLYRRRDAGGVAFPQLERTRPAVYDLRASRLARRSLWIGWITEQPGILLWWFAGIAAFSGIEASLVPGAIRIVKESSQLAKYLSDHGGFLTPELFLSALMSMAAIMAGAFAASQVARWGGDASQHRIDALLTQPVSMERLLLERMLSLVVTSLVVVAGAVALGIWAGAAISGYDISAAGLARVVLVLALLCFAAGGIGLLAVTMLRSGGAGGVVAAVLVASFVLTTVAGLLSWPEWASRPSLFDAFGTPYLSMPDAGRVTYLAALGVIGTVLATVAMRRGARIAL